MSNTYSEQNAAWRGSLVSLVTKLSDKDMGKAAGGPGWTVTGLLGHLAFYDLRAVALLAKWEKDGISPSPNDVDIINESMRTLLNAVPPRDMKKLALDAAEAVDALIDALEPDFLSRVETGGKPVKLNRAAHRQHHVEQIEKALG